MRVYFVTAFPKTEFGGNKAGVVLDADHLTDDEMVQIAKEINFSETAFVSKSEIADFKVRFFTPFHEVDLCGHATIATFNLLRDKGYIQTGLFTQETKAGILKLDVKQHTVFMEQAAPQFFDEVPKKEIERCFLQSHFVDDSYKVIIGSTGLREIFVPVIDINTLHKLKPLKEELIELSVEHQVIGVHLFAKGMDCDAYSRNFAPLVGIDEESATGTSNGVLGAYFKTYIKPKNTEFVFRQGYAMNFPSEIKVKVIQKDKLNMQVWVGGTANCIDEVEKEF